VKRTVRTYLSRLLLVCLVIQISPISLFHSHADHHDEEHSVKIDMAQSDLSGDYLYDADHDSEEDCHICQVQQSFNNQAYTISEQNIDFDAVTRSAISLDVVASIDDYLLNGSPGRAPPVA
jgi:hypothetical protein